VKATRVLPSAERIAGGLLAIAALTILALALLVMFELDREAQLHREVIGGLQVKDSLAELRTQMDDLVHAARMVAVAGDAASAQAIERRAVEIDAELDYLAQHPSREDRPAFEELSGLAHLLVVNARTVAAARSTRLGAPRAQMEEVERLAQSAAIALQRTLESQTARINDRTLSQLRGDETLRAYVWWLLAGSAGVLLGLFGFYRWARMRERAVVERIERMAHYDAVTGLPNRVLLLDRLEQEVARAHRNESPFALLMVDLDGFKQVNDTWGHASGDRVLAIVGERARQCVRASDTIGRLGGDEFLAILPDTGRAGAIQVAEKLREALSRPYPIGQSAPGTIGASIGMSLYGEHGTSAADLQRAADAALYEAKRTGKNRVLEATPALQRRPAT
jgi:diguanylate cyclase (GGDEF)-like protein